MAMEFFFAFSFSKDTRDVKIHGSPTSPSLRVHGCLTPVVSALARHDSRDNLHSYVGGKGSRVTVSIGNSLSALPG